MTPANLPRAEMNTDIDIWTVEVTYPQTVDGYVVTLTAPINYTVEFGSEQEAAAHVSRIKGDLTVEEKAAAIITVTYLRQHSFQVYR